MRFGHGLGPRILAAHQGAEAVAEFQKIIDGSSIVVSDPVGALAHLQLGRALAMSKDMDRAKQAYQDFFRLWAHADERLPDSDTSESGILGG